MDAVIKRWLLIWDVGKMGLKMGI